MNDEEVRVTGGVQDEGKRSRDGRDKLGSQEEGRKLAKGLCSSPTLGLGRTQQDITHLLKEPTAAFSQGLLALRPQQTHPKGQPKHTASPAGRLGERIRQAQDSQQDKQEETKSGGGGGGGERGVAADLPSFCTDCRCPGGVRLVIIFAKNVIISFTLPSRQESHREGAKRGEGHLRSSLEKSK